MELIPLATKKDKKRFLEFPVSLYRGNPYWIRPLDADIEAVFDPRVNKTFQGGECQRWLLQEGDKIIGRIAAFVIRTGDPGDSSEPRGGVGFFECVDRQEAANALFDGARDWLKQQGATFMDGPVNFGKRDKWWGLLTKGYELEPNYQCNFNFPYYRELFEAYGFKTYFEQYTFIKPIHEPLSSRLEYKAGRIAEDPSYTFEHLRLSEFDKYAADIIKVYNQAWKKHQGVDPLTPDQGKAMMARIKPIVDEKLIWVAYYKGDPVAIFVNLPEVNQILRHLNGRLGSMGKLKFFWLKKTGRISRVLGMVFGVVPEHQGKGVDGAIIHACARVIRTQRRYQTIELSGIGDFNPKMVLVARQVGGQLGKVHTTYRYLFDRNAPFERMKPIR
jgi:hypothetical protein